MNLRLSTLSLFCCLSPFAMKAQDFSVGGIKLGSPFQEAIAKAQATLKSHEPPITTRPYRFTGIPTGLESFEAVQLYDRYNKDTWFIEAISGKVFYVSRMIRFDPGTEPNVETTVNDVKAKMGGKSPTNVDAQGLPQGVIPQQFDRWYFDAQGKQIPNRVDPYCSVGTMEATLAEPRPMQQKNPCAKGYAAYIQSKSRTEPALLSVLVTTMVDQTAYSNWDQKFYDVVVAARKDAATKASQKKAPL